MIARLRNIYRYYSIERIIRETVGMSNYCKLFFCKTLTEKILKASKMLSLSEEKYVELISERLNLPFLTELPLPSGAVLSSSRIALIEMQRLSFVPIINGTQIEAVAGLDQTSIIKKYPFLKQYRFFITTPSALLIVFKKINQSMQLPAAVYDKRDRGEQALALFERLVRYAEQLQATQIVLQHCETHLEYSVYDQEQKKYRGVIAQSITEHFLSFCQISAESKEAFTINKDGEQCVCFFGENKGEFIVQLRKQNYTQEQAVVYRLPERTEARRSTENKFDNKYLLVIDDNQDFSRVLKRFLEREGFIVQSALSVEEARQYLRTTETFPAAIISDLHMPRQNGIDLLTQKDIFNDKECPPIIILTSDESVESELCALERGATVYLAKSRDPRVLLAYLRGVEYRMPVAGAA